MAVKKVVSKRLSVVGRKRKAVDELVVPIIEEVVDVKKELWFRSRRLLVVLGVIGLLALWWYKTNTWPIVAVVNYRPIFRMEVDRELYAQSGKEVVNNLITKNLVAEELKNRKIIISAADADAKMAEIKKQFGTEDNFKQVLTMQGLTESQVREQIALRLGLEKMVDPSTDSAKLQSEISKLLEDLRAKAKIWTVR